MAREPKQVYEAILSEITDGRLPPNTRLIQDELAAAYGVSYGFRLIRPG